MSSISNDGCWKRYYGTWRPTCQPHEIVNTDSITDGTIWKIGGGLARWTSHWDSNIDTDFWYCIKDAPYDISEVKSKRRYYIKKGIANFSVKRIDVNDYLERIYTITDTALREYNDYSGPEDYDSFKSRIIAREDVITYGAFSAESGELCGFIYIKEYRDYVDFMTLKVLPEYEKQQINAALVYGLINAYNNRLGQDGFYICDGMRATSHKTNFQEYLKKYFNFRYAYCQLNVAYQPALRCMVKMLYPFRKAFRGHNKGVLGKVNVIMELEEIARTTKRQIEG